MHHFLITSGTGFKESHKNEVLTDTAALYLGFSEHMNKGQIGVGYLSYSRRELMINTYEDYLDSPAGDILKIEDALQIYTKMANCINRCTLEEKAAL